jgi:AcrR family transcriptional regulator
MPGSNSSRRESPADLSAEAHGNVLRGFNGLVTTERRLDRSRVLGPRAERTKRSLVDSAWEMFRTRGYTGTTVADIAKGASVSLPTFYQYFGDITDVLRAIIVDFIKDSLTRGIDRWDVRHGRAGLRPTVRDFVQTYVDYRDLMELWETARLVDPRIRALSWDYHRVYWGRIESALHDARALGILREGVDIPATAEVLTAMLQNYCFERIVMAPQPADVDLDHMADVLTVMWTAAVDLDAAR